MIENADFLTAFSIHRLRGEAPPPDLAILLGHRDALVRQTGFAFDSSSSWAPWLDTSYLRESEWANPDIRANVKAIAEVCASIDFVAADEERNYFGYWRGQADINVSQAPIVRLDNEGQFDFCGTTNLAGAILTAGGGGLFEEVRSWMQGIGIGSLPTVPYDLFDVDIHPSPRQLHRTLYEKLLIEEQRG
ncbi:hypothetical protein NWF24_06805 [Variovorax paradoxus]|uniref:hypothetical protein n=1 Tax=Variovorax paradoxus TaxID=34073 RepID=UPI0021AD20ED|nr:hypothetical protein [Variovorax paradoxus]UVH59114.1 hypothetical protein NWF24_06805 [Variovorax paradoxus]